MDGLVMKTNDDNAVILLKSGEFRCVKNCGYHVGENIKIKQKPIIYIVISALLLLLCGGLLSAYFIPASYVCIDMNSSIMLNVNYFGSVIKAVPADDDARSITKVLKKDSVDDMIEDIAEIAYKQNNIGEYPVISVTTYKASADILEEVYDIDFDIPVKYIVQEAEKKDLAYAQAQNISLGKACLIRKYASENADMEDMKDKSISEIIGADETLDYNPKNYRKNNSDRLRKNSNY